jgi:hypothetical protein
MGVRTSDPTPIDSSAEAHHAGVSSSREKKGGNNEKGEETNRQKEINDRFRNPCGKRPEQHDSR